MLSHAVFSCTPKLFSAIFQLVLMRYAFSALILAFLMLLCVPYGFAMETKGTAAAVKNDVQIEQAPDQDEELPDNPLSLQPETGVVQGEEKPEIGIQPDKEGISDKAKKMFEALRDTLHDTFSPDDFDIPVVMNEAVDRYIKVFTGPKRAIFARWLVRSEKYAPTIRGILKENGLPEDLVYLSMIESGFNMKAHSPAHAIGPWQFINETGRRYGLKVDYWVDERYDLEKSTVAAARYLKSLFDQFGCWYLAAASYNAGENRVKRAIEKGDTKDFWELRQCKRLPKETQEYVPQLIAAALIAKEPEKYGFDGLNSPPVHHLTKIVVPGGVPLKGIARALSLDVADLKALNPEILKGITPPDRKEYRINLPGDPELDVVSRQLETALADDRRVVDVVRLAVRKKDSLTGILKRYGVSRSDLALVNGDEMQVRRGRIVYIPRFASLKRDERPLSEQSGHVGSTNHYIAGETESLSARDDGGNVILLKSRTKSHGTQAPKVRLVAQTVKKAVKGHVATTHRRIGQRPKRAAR